MMRQYELVERVQKYDPSANEALLNRAYVYAMQAHGHQKRASGDPFFSHPLEVAAILTEFKLDDATIAAALLHDVIEDTDVTRAEIDQKFGKEIGDLVEGLTKIKKLDLVTRKAEQAENFRKLLVAISTDIRVLLIKLADRLHNMRTLEHMKPESRRRVSEETLEIYAPLAGRMGMQTMREELEQLAFKWGYPDAYDTVVDKLADIHRKNVGLVEEIIAALKAKLSQAGLHAEVWSREKKPFSIWRKMENRQISLEQLSDIYGFRIVVDDVDACYRALGIVHSAWRAVPGRFKDYISTPKQNNYQSIHTTVVGPGHQWVELQIRTERMHQVADYGVAAHALYKDGIKLSEYGANGGAAPQKENPYMWLRRLVDTLLEGDNPEEFLEHTKLELFQDQVFCFTPKGRLIALPRNATPIDFAYAVHTDVGNSCVGAVINGRQLPLTTQLRNGDQVEILTARGQTPPAAWERIAITGKARSSIRRAARDAAAPAILRARPPSAGNGDAQDRPRVFRRQAPARSGAAVAEVGGGRARGHRPRRAAREGRDPSHGARCRARAGARRPRASAVAAIAARARKAGSTSPRSSGSSSAGPEAAPAASVPARPGRPSPFAASRTTCPSPSRRAARCPATVSSACFRKARAFASSRSTRPASRSTSTSAGST